jgi:hypothetical protein
MLPLSTLPSLASPLPAALDPPPDGRLQVFGSPSLSPHTATAVTELLTAGLSKMAAFLGATLGPVM